MAKCHVIFFVMIDVACGCGITVTYVVGSCFCLKVVLLIWL